VFRGFYFTSALQEGMPLSEQSQRVARRFALAGGEAALVAGSGNSGFFLLNLFRKVIFADKDLVSQYASKTKVRLKYAAFFGAVLLLGASLGGWSWAYMGNRQLVSNVQADLDKVIKLQARRLDLQSRLEALEIIQDRIVQLEKYRDARPWSLRMGLYQGELLERKLREEYFAGVRNVMLMPVVESLETQLSEMNVHAAEAPIANVDDGYNTLKSYLMLADKSHAEASHLNDQLPRHWRAWLENNRGAMPREQMIHSAERMMTFYLAQIPDPAWPRIDLKLALVDQSRENLRRVVRGLPARERVYADIRARANTRFPSATVARMVGEQDQALLTGSYAVPGAYTREAWEKFVQEAFRNAANRELQSTDWVLKTAARDDLTLEGSPEQIQKGLTELYKADYAREWQRFVQGVNIANLKGFDAAVAAMNRLGDPQASPLSRLLLAIHQQTAWDNPSVMSAEVKEARTGFINWIKYSLLRRSPAQVNINLPAERPVAMGAVGREFAGIGKLVASGDKDASLMRTYMDALSKLRGRLNQLKNQGDPGPGARQLMQQTLDGSGSELADALRYVDEQMLIGMSDTQRQAIRPILVRPLMQTFAVLIPAAEAEINKTWLAQVYEPFQQSLANKYPFSPNGRVEAASAEIAQIFGPDGVIARFATSAMGPLVLRRGDVLAARTWADMGITLAPQMVARFPGWVAPIAAGGVASPASAQTVFQIQPLPAPGTQEYTVEIDGQQLRYRNTPAQWASMVHPSPEGMLGARITAVAFDGRSVEVFNEPGQLGLKRMIDAAAKQKRDGGVFELRWTSSGVTVAMGLKIISSAESTGGAPPDQGFRGLRLPDTIVGAPLAASAPGASPTAPPLTPANGGPPTTAVAGGAAPVGALTGAVR
jgi:type VI secretion system protein ImpL